MRPKRDFCGLWRWEYVEDLSRDPIGFSPVDISVRNYHLAFALTRGPMPLSRSRRQDRTVVQMSRKEPD